MDYSTTRTLSPFTWVAVALVVIGAINWGLVGLFGFNLVAAIFGEMSLLSRIIYIIVGLAGLYLPFALASLGTAGHGTPARGVGSTRGTAAG